MQAATRILLPAPRSLLSGCFLLTQPVLRAAAQDGEL